MSRNLLLLFILVNTLHFRQRAIADEIKSECLSSETSCKARFSRNGWGCCNFENAVCCENNLLCCPKGYTCSDSIFPGGSSFDIVTECVAADRSIKPSSTICKTGPPLSDNTDSPIILILGDSVSIGYTPFVAAGIDGALVLHTPHSSDGGSEEAGYGVTCLDAFLRTPRGEMHDDRIIGVLFNFGLHNLEVDPKQVVPGQAGLMDHYGRDLTNITDRLVERIGSEKLLFALTTPELCDAGLDERVRQLNTVARSIMDLRNIEVADSHSALIQECGNAPQSQCFGKHNCFCPHCDEIGYKWLAESVLIPKIQERFFWV